MKIQSSLKVVGFAVMLAAANMANAVTTDWGTIDPSTPFSKSFSAQRLGSFEDFYNFSLLSAADGLLKASVTITMNGEPHSGIDDLVFALYTSANQLVNQTYDALSKTYFFTVAPGSYYLKVSGSGWVGNELPTPPTPAYNGYMAMTAAVPEPETYAMFLAGLGLVGTVIRRRSRDF